MEGIVIKEKNSNAGRRWVVSGVECPGMESDRVLGNNCRAQEDRMSGGI